MQEAVHKIKKATKLTTQEMVLIAVFAVVLVVLSRIAVPFASGVPITLQTFAVALCGLALGTRRGVYCVCVYLLLGVIGLPVFAGSSSGLGVFAGYTGGFLIGFVPMAALCGRKKVLYSVLGLLACHALGIAWFAVVAGVNLWQAALTASFPYLIKDGISLVFAYLSARFVEKALRAARFSC